MNTLVMIGNLTRDPEVSYSQNGLAIAHISIAVNRFKTQEGGPDADFFRVTAFGKTAELVEKYLARGKKVGIEGHIQNNNYEDKEGKKVYRDQIIATRVEFLSPKSEGTGEQGYYPPNDGPAMGPPSPPEFDDDTPPWM